MHPILAGNIQILLEEELKQRSYSKVFILTDTNTANFCFPKIDSCLASVSIHHYSIPAGESSKSLETVIKILNELMQQEYRRNDLFITLGGGMVCDIGAYCASTFKRGINLIHIPTSLLAMVDASIGGKTGFNFNGIKNCIGTFYHPIVTFLDDSFLETLPLSEKWNGFAEMLKHGLLSNRNHWEELIQLNPNIIGLHTILESALFKSHIVKQDVTEFGVRKVLNLGHTIGHAIEETITNDGAMLPHGTAVMAGLIIEQKIALEMFGFPLEVLTTLIEFGKNHYELPIISNSARNTLIRLLHQDKKQIDDKIRMSLVKEIGQCEIDISVSMIKINNAISFYNEVLSHD